ncbi:hypothetical protein GCM10022235_66680 [Kribbella ginsengisoli]|uniref:Uncharacterized protein n=1 Tax=Kribbella ginsengisoli TaxID=363865 RepID=A0ABP6YNX5_9ACTN
MPVTRWASGSDEAVGRWASWHGVRAAQDWATPKWAGRATPRRTEWATPKWAEWATPGWAEWATPKWAERARPGWAELGEAGAMVGGRGLAVDLGH